MKLNLFFNYSCCAVGLAVGGEMPHYEEFEQPHMKPPERKQKLNEIRDKIMAVSPL
ncbi:MAG: hypothetical protein GY816_00225 [Cytophagales bacterium]|nr:hypothetical protein [Cytophagales bacterium]